MASEAKIQLAAISVCGWLFSGCGGGGGGGTGQGGGATASPAPATSTPAPAPTPSENNLVVDIDKRTLRFLSLNSPDSSTDTLSFSLSGTPASDTYYGVFEPVADAQIHADVRNATAKSLQMAITMRSEKPSLSGNFQLKLCKDEACKSVVWSGSIPYAYANYKVDDSPVALQVTQRGAPLLARRQVSPAPTAATDLRIDVPHDAAGWLGAGFDADGALVLTATPNAVSSGVHSTNVRIFTGADQATRPVTVPVTLSVAAGLTAPTDASINVGVHSQAAVKGSFALTVNGEQSTPWTVAKSAPWIVLDRTSGIGSATIGYTIDKMLLAGLVAPAVASDVLTISAPGMDSVLHKITVSNTPIEIAMLTPGLAWSGQSTQLTLRGRGFGQLAGVSAFLLDGQPIRDGNIVSDTESKLFLPALAPGRHTIALLDAAGLVLTKGMLNVADPAPFPAGAIDNVGAKDALLYSAGRSALYVMNRSQKALLRFRFASGKWTNDLSVPIDPAAGIGLSPDESILYSTGPNELLEERDPDTLTVRARYRDIDALTLFDRRTDKVLSITNDGRVWFGQNQWSELRYFDSRTKTFSRIRGEEIPGEMKGLYTISYPIYTVSGDGERMFVTEGGGQHLDHSLRYDAATRSFQRIGFVARNVSLAVSRDGERLLSDKDVTRKDVNSALYDAAGKLLGHLPREVFGDYEKQPVISPDGNRAYVIQYQRSDDSGKPVRFDVVDTNAMTKIGEVSIPAGACMEVDTYRCYGAPLAIAPSGNTMFYAGYNRIVVIPVSNDVPVAAKALRFRLAR